MGAWKGIYMGLQDAEDARLRRKQTALEERKVAMLEAQAKEDSMIKRLELYKALGLDARGSAATGGGSGSSDNAQKLADNVLLLKDRMSKGYADLPAEIQKQVDTLMDNLENDPQAASDALAAIQSMDKAAEGYVPLDRILSAVNVVSTSKGNSADIGDIFQTLNLPVSEDTIKLWSSIRRPHTVLSVDPAAAIPFNAANVKGREDLFQSAVIARATTTPNREVRMPDGTTRTTSALLDDARSSNPSAQQYAVTILAANYATPDFVDGLISTNPSAFGNIRKNSITYQSAQNLQEAWSSQTGEAPDTATVQVPPTVEPMPATTNPPRPDGIQLGVNPFEKMIYNPNDPNSKAAVNPYATPEAQTGLYSQDEITPYNAMQWQQ